MSSARVFDLETTHAAERWAHPELAPVTPDFRRAWFVAYGEGTQHTCWEATQQRGR